MKIFRPICESDREAWNPLWFGYLEFYQVDLTPEQTEIAWNRFFDPEFNAMGFVVEFDGEVVGMAHCTFHNSTWLPTPDLYLEDLFVAKTHRRLGLGRFLIESCAEFGKSAGSTRMYWMTQRSNETAQNLYYKIAELSEYIIFKKDFQ
jgi:GNAT superfamily N-acetyltransferase